MVGMRGKGIMGAACEDGSSDMSTRGFISYLSFDDLILDGSDFCSRSLVVVGQVEDLYTTQSGSPVGRFTFHG